MRRTFWLFTIAVMLSSCGFHLRGMVDMPRWLNHVAVIDEQHQHDLAPYLVDYLKSYHLTVEPTEGSAHYWLIIQNSQIQKHIMSISSSTTPRQYELIYTVQFKLVQAKGRDMIPLTTIQVTKQSTINSDRILGSNQEQTLIEDEMRREAAIQIMNRVSIKASKMAQPSPHL